MTINEKSASLFYLMNGTYYEFTVYFANLISLCFEHSSWIDYLFREFIFFFETTINSLSVYYWYVAYYRVSRLFSFIGFISSLLHSLSNELSVNVCNFWSVGPNVNSQRHFKGNVNIKRKHDGLWVNLWNVKVVIIKNREFLQYNTMNSLFDSRIHSKFTICFAWFWVKTNVNYIQLDQTARFDSFWQVWP